MSDVVKVIKGNLSPITALAPIMQAVDWVVRMMTVITAFQRSVQRTSFELVNPLSPCYHCTPLLH